MDLLEGLRQEMRRNPHFPEFPSGNPYYNRISPATGESEGPHLIRLQEVFASSLNQLIWLPATHPRVWKGDETFLVSSTDTMKMQCIVLLLRKGPSFAQLL